MIRAAFFDIDGTLVSFKTHKIPQSAVDAIKAFHDQGGRVYISTGRPIAIKKIGTGLLLRAVRPTRGIWASTTATCTATLRPATRSMFAQSQHSTFNS